MHSTLVLNATFEPINISSSRKAVKNIILGKAVSVLDSEDKIMHASEYEIPVPYVVLLTKQVNYYPYNKRKRRLLFSLKGVLVRDGGVCVYCSRKATTVDHVWPKDKGGKSTWENCVAACTKCNSDKSNKTLDEMGWILPFTPGAPNPWSMGSPYISLARKAPNKKLLTIWLPYIERFDSKVITDARVSRMLGVA